MIEPFKNPGLERPTPLRIEGDVIYGHFCAWGTPHLALPGVTPPRSASDYRYFHLSGYQWQGQDIDVGKITLHTTHASIRVTGDEAVRHYEDTGTVAAYVRAGEDQHGGWFSGKLAKSLSDEDTEALRGSTPSGDWRGYNGRRELIGILAVNVPGFPIERERALVASAEHADRLALVASGLVVNETGPGERLRIHMARKALKRRMKK
jgi:hypothetical protein